MKRVLVVLLTALSIILINMGVAAANVVGDEPGGDLVVTGIEYVIVGDHQGVNAYKSITVTDGGTLFIQPNDTIDGAVIEVNAAGGTGKVLITNNSSIIPQGYYTTSTIPDHNGRGVTIDAKEIQIDAGSTIDASGQGYKLGEGPGAGIAAGYGGGWYVGTGSGGGAYGGEGGHGYGGYDGGSTYGSVSNPIDIGSGAGITSASIGGIGGGAIRLKVVDTLYNDGKIISNGMEGDTAWWNSGSGGGSGGSILINTDIVKGIGQIAANGGFGGHYGGGGGGGRIAFYYNDKSEWTGTVSVNPGSSWVGGAGKIGSSFNITAASLDGVLGQNDWYISDVQVSLNSTNVDGSPINNIEYSYDNVKWIKYTDRFTLSTNGINTLYYRSIDNDGDVEAANQKIIKIDKTPPEIIINSPVDLSEYIWKSTITADWEAKDSISQIYSVTGTIPSGQLIDSVIPGTKIFTVTAIDNAGNETTKSIGYYIIYENLTSTGPWQSFKVNNCQSPISADGNLAAMADDSSNPGKLYYYNLNTKQLFDTYVNGQLPSIKGGKIAYYEPGEGWWQPSGIISIFDIQSNSVIPTEINSAAKRQDYSSPSRYFNGEYIVYVDKNDMHVKFYSVSARQTTDTGEVASNSWERANTEPQIDGNIITFVKEDGNVAFYNITTGEVKAIEVGRQPVVSGNIISYLVGEERWNSSLKYYRINTDEIIDTGVTGVYSQSIDGDRIIINGRGTPKIGNFILYDISTNETKDTGLFGCTGTGACYVEISGDTIFTERWERGANSYDPILGQRIDIYPADDLNGNGTIDSECVAVFADLGLDEISSVSKRQGPYADRIVDFSIAGNVNNSRPSGTTANTLGAPDGLTRGLGTYGSDVIVEFTDNKAVDDNGADLAIYAEDYLYKVYVKSDDMVDFQPIEDPDKSYKGNVQIDFNGKFDNVAQVKIVSNSALYGAKIDAVQTIHPGPFVDFANNNGSLNPELALGPKDNKYTVITAAYGITHSVNLAFTDNLAVDGGGNDLIIYGNAFSGNYKLSIREDFDTMTYTPIGAFKGIQSIDLANYDISQAVEVKIEAASPKTAIDAIEAIHTGPSADKIIYSNVKKPDISAAKINNILGAKDNQYASLFLRQFVEIQFVDNQVINREGPDIAVYASQEHWSEPFKVFVKENASDDEYVDIKPGGSFTKNNTNISLPENIQKVEVLKIVGNGAFEAAKIDAIEALHSDKDEVMTAISSDYNVYPVGSNALVTASFTPCDTKLESINIEVILNGVRTDYFAAEPVKDGFTSSKALNIGDIQPGKNTIVVKAFGDNNELLGENNYAVYGSLNEAMNILGEGSALRLSKGTFEGPFTISKNLYIQGANTSTNYQKSIAYPDKTIIQGPDSGAAIDVKADFVELYGLTVNDGDYGIYTKGYKGLKARFNNIRKYNDFGVYLVDSGTNITADLPEPDLSDVSWNYIDTERTIDCDSSKRVVRGKAIPTVPSPNGVKIVNSNVNYVRGNTIKNNVTGVKLVQSRSAVISNSFLSNCISIYRDPIGGQVLQDEISGNEITDTELGIVFSHSDNIHLNIFDNIISNAKVAILGMEGIADIYNNQISDSDVGIFAPLPTVSTYDNIFSNNIQDKPASLSPEIKQIINDEILESQLNEPYYLSELIAGYNLQSGIAYSLNTKLKNVSINLFSALDDMETSEKLAANSLNTAINNITAFQNEVKALNESKMNQSQKDTLTVISEILKRQVSYIKINI